MGTKLVLGMPNSCKLEEDVRPQFKNTEINSVSTP